MSPVHALEAQGPRASRTSRLKRRWCGISYTLTREVFRSTELMDGSQASDAEHEEPGEE